MIPEAAVEAAMDYVWAHDDDRPITKETLRVALEAAAPHLVQAAKADAWDEGGRAAIEREHTYGREEKAKFSNPYREAPK